MDSIGGPGQSEKLDAAVRYALHKGKLIFPAVGDGEGPPAALLRSAHPGWTNHQVTKPAAESYAPPIALPAPRRPSPPDAFPRPDLAAAEPTATSSAPPSSARRKPAPHPHPAYRTRQTPAAFFPGPSPGWEPACSLTEP
ncbi:hypothetical protein [Streptomyces sp. NBC_01443]|uniref:hypothetical protein n=1 Tax=Streptomyces sp. NBC_01443 TaxID=2903868 RepID=UPI00225325F7|nr:hypothetical protein [Streptomyces sp. NBC_01443]MCX4629627.1 hypothetical protein [Streptomyces sp. NBC_01443]